MKVKHKKTGELHSVISDSAICTTRKFFGSTLVVYKKFFGTNVLVCDKQEFWGKFERIEG